MFRNNKKIIIGAIIANLLGSIIVYAAGANGNMDVGPCEALSDPPRVCLKLSAPVSLSLVTTVVPPAFIYDNTDSSAYFYSPGEVVQVSDARTIGTFTLSAAMSPLLATGGPTIPYNRIGILTYNESTTSSLDGYTLGAGSGIGRPSSQLDPLPVHRSLSNPMQFNESDFHNSALDKNISNNYFTYFLGDGTNNSDPREIILPLSGATVDQGTYAFGVGLRVEFLADDLENFSIRDNNYSGTLTFTLTPN